MAVLRITHGAETRTSCPQGARRIGRTLGESYFVVLLGRLDTRGQEFQPQQKLPFSDRHPMCRATLCKEPNGTELKSKGLFLKSLELPSFKSCRQNSHLLHVFTYSFDSSWNGCIWQKETPSSLYYARQIHTAY